MTVLLVGRPTVARGYVCGMLTEAGHTVVAADTPSEGVALLHAGNWDALVTDIGLRDEALVRGVILGLPRYVPECRVLMLRGTLRDFLAVGDNGILPIRVTGMSKRDAFWDWGVSA